MVDGRIPIRSRLEFTGCKLALEWTESIKGILQETWELYDLKPHRIEVEPAGHFYEIFFETTQMTGGSSHCNHIQATVGIK